jgi:Uma2 family endonuclease
VQESIEMSNRRRGGEPVSHQTYRGEYRIATADNETVLDLDTLQGTWTEEQYLRLTDHSRRLVEFTNGFIEILVPPTDKHQSVSGRLLLALHPIAQRVGGVVLQAPLRLRLGERKFREPDLLLLLDAIDPRRENRYWLGADLVIEVASPADPERDIVVKRADYEAAQIPEYWLVNPEDETVTVLRLDAGRYVEHGVYRRGGAVASMLLGDTKLSVDHLFSTGR